MRFPGGVEPCAGVPRRPAAGCLGGRLPTAPILCPGADGVGILQPPGLCPRRLHQRAGLGQHVAARCPPRLQLRRQVSEKREDPLPCHPPASAAAALSAARQRCSEVMASSLFRGNWLGEAPYKVGQPCSACPPTYGGGCSNNMCFTGLKSNQVGWF